jgi:hypothetical protein
VGTRVGAADGKAVGSALGAADGEAVGLNVQKTEHFPGHAIANGPAQSTC